MRKAELIFIPSPGVGHLVSTVEMAKVLLDYDDRFSVTFLIMKLPFDSATDKFVESLTASSTCNGIRFIILPSNDQPDSDTNPRNFLLPLIERQKPHVKEAVSKLTQSLDQSPDSSRLAGFVLDMFCTAMIDVGNEFGVPCYIFFTSGAAFLGLMFYVQALHDEEKVDPTEFKDSDVELAVPSLVNRLPAAKVLPSVMLFEDHLQDMLKIARRHQETKGIIVNTFLELESYAVNSFSNSKSPPVYPVGPILNLKGDRNDKGSDESHKYKEIMEWLDDQPASSVVFLCFGSEGSFGVDQVKEIAYGLEHSGHRFLWSLRQPPPKDKIGFPTDYLNPQQVLPEGFLDRTADIGKVIGWAPQVKVLAHPAVGGFVSHCGWNSTLESIWFGVPVATWPMSAEQQFNAFELVVELGLGVEIKMDYRKEVMVESEDLVSADEIERGIRSLMGTTNEERRKKVKEMSEVSRRALMDGGSSHCSLGRFVADVMVNMT